jgi:hypothetical protein
MKLDGQFKDRQDAFEVIANGICRLNDIVERKDEDGLFTGAGDEDEDGAVVGDGEEAKDRSRQRVASSRDEMDESI